MHRIVPKLLTLPPTILIVVTITFLILRLTPGDPAEIMLGEYATEEATAALRAELGLDQPVIVQYGRYVASFIRGDFGRSITSGRLVSTELADVLPYTASLAALSILFSILLGIPAGVVAALNHNKIIDRVITVLLLAGISTPVFVIGFLLLLFFSYRIPLFPLIGVGADGDMIDTLYHLILPAITLGLFSGALIARITRSSMLEVLGRDYIRTARSKGLVRNAVIWQHGFRNVLVTVVSVIGLQFATLLGGTVITEMVFSRQGIGKLLVNAILARDYPVVQGVIAMFLLMVILVNLITDLLYAGLDPRLD